MLFEADYRPRGVAGELAEEVEHAVGAVDRDVGELERGRSPRWRRSRPGGWACPRHGGRRPPRRPRRRRGRRRRTRRRRPRSPRPGCGDLALVHARANGPRSRCGRARSPGRGWRASSVSTGSSRRRWRRGPSSRRVWTATASPLSSTNASPASYRRSTRGSSAEERRRPCGGRGETTRRLVEDQRSLPYWPKRCSSLPASADRVADLVEPAEGERLTGRAAGDHRDRGHDVRQFDQHLPGVGVDVRGRGIVDDRGQRAVEVEADHGLRGGADQRGVPLLGLGERELHDPIPTMDAPRPDPRVRGEPWPSAC